MKAKPPTKTQGNQDAIVGGADKNTPGIVTKLYIHEPPSIGHLVRIPSPKEGIEPVLSVIVPGESMVEKMVIANEPHESLIMSHHASYIQQRKDYRKLEPGYVQKGPRNQNPESLKRSFRPVSRIGLERRRDFILVMYVMIAIKIAMVEKDVGHVEPDIIA